MFCARHAHPDERLVRRFLDTPPEKRGNRDTNFSGCSMFRRLNRAFDSLAIDDLQQLFSCHLFLTMIRWRRRLPTGHLRRRILRRLRRPNRPGRHHRGPRKEC
jgi:hypothetical protein